MSSAVRLQSAGKTLRLKGNILEFSMFTYESTANLKMS